MSKLEIRMSSRDLTLVTIIAIAGIGFIIALTLILGMNWPAVFTSILIVFLGVIGGWLYFRWGRYVTNVAKDEPRTTRLKRSKHETRRLKK